MRTSQRRKMQRGAISLLGAASIVLSLFSFEQVLQYTNAKILDRELDNYARDVAAVALRSELAITMDGIKNGTMSANQTRLVTDDLLMQVKMYTYTDSLQPNSKNLTKRITFGNLASSAICDSIDPTIRQGCFIPLTRDQFNPRSAKTPIDFSAVAVQLRSTDSFYSYTPQGRAIYGMPQANTLTDSGCYCKNRYATCLDMNLTVADLSSMPSSEADAVIIKGSDARKNYCNYGFSEPKISNSVATKYPYIKFNDAWIGRPPETINFFMFYSTSYDGEAFNLILNQKPVSVLNGDDPLKNTSGFAASFSSSYCFIGCGSADLAAKDQSLSAFEKSDISLSTSQSDYRCEKPGFFLFPTTYSSCDSASNSNDVVLEDSTYIGYQGTCIPSTNTTNVAMSRCLSYNDGSTPRYESCLEIERRSSISMNFFQRMTAFFLGPILNWQRSYEALNCEMQQVQYKGWLFWGGWT